MVARNQELINDATGFCLSRALTCHVRDRNCHSIPIVVWHLLYDASCASAVSV